MIDNNLSLRMLFFISVPRTCIFSFCALYFSLFHHPARSDRIRLFKTWSAFLFVSHFSLPLPFSSSSSAFPAGIRARANRLNLLAQFRPHIRITSILFCHFRSIARAQSLVLFHFSLFYSFHTFLGLCALSFAHFSYSLLPDYAILTWADASVFCENSRSGAASRN